MIKDDEIAAKIAGHELKSLESLMNCDLDGINCCFCLKSSLSLVNGDGCRIMLSFDEYHRLQRTPFGCDVVSAD